MNKQNKPSYLTTPNVILFCMILFIVYRVGLGCFIAVLTSRECAAQKKLTHSKEIADIIDASFDRSVSYINATLDINEYIKPSLHYIYQTYIQQDQDKPVTPLQDSAVLYYYHFQEGSFFGYANMDYDTLSDELTRVPLLSGMLGKGDCDDMALWSYTYACLKGIPCCIFIVEGSSGKSGHARFAMEKHIFQQTDHYQHYVKMKQQYAGNDDVQEHCNRYLYPLEVVVGSKTYCFFDQAQDFKKDLKRYRDFCASRGIDNFEDIWIVDNADVLQYLRDNNMTEFFQEEFQ